MGRRFLGKRMICTRVPAAVSEAVHAARGGRRLTDIAEEAYVLWLDHAMANGNGKVLPNPAVDHPAHYRTGPVEVIDLIEGFSLGFHLGNVLKYILRAGHKGAVLEDLKKARWYLDREIARREKAGEPGHPEEAA